METLKGKNIINRMSDLMNYGGGKSAAKSNPKLSFNNLEYSITLTDGRTLGILRENAKFYIKETKSKNPTVNDFEYIGGIINGSKQSYRSYSDAIKFLNLMIGESNKKNPFAKAVNLYECDNTMKKGEMQEKKEPEKNPEESKKKDDSELDEEGKMNEKTVLKIPQKQSPQQQPAPAPQASAAPSVSDKPSADTGIDGGLDLGDGSQKDANSSDSLDLGGDTGGDDLDLGGSEDLGLGGSSDEETKQIQKITGKLGQKMRDLDQPNEDLTKYVFNSVVSSLDLNDLDDQNKKEIIKKFKKKLKGEEEEKDVADELGTDETGDTGLEDTGDGLDLGDDSTGKDEELAECDAPFGEKKEPQNIKSKNAPFNEKPTKLKTESKIKKTIEKYFDIMPLEKPVVKEVSAKTADLLTEGKKKCKTIEQEISLKKVIDFDKNLSVHTLKENLILKTNHDIVVGKSKHEKYIMIETTGKIKGVLMDTTTKKGMVYRMKDKNDYLNFIKLGK